MFPIKLHSQMSFTCVVRQNHSHAGLQEMIYLKMKTQELKEARYEGVSCSWRFLGSVLHKSRFSDWFPKNMVCVFFEVAPLFFFAAVLNERQPPCLLQPLAPPSAGRRGERAAGEAFG